MIVYGWPYSWNGPAGGLSRHGANSWYMAFIPEATTFHSTQELCNAVNRTIYADVVDRLRTDGATPAQIQGLHEIGDSRDEFYFSADMPHINAARKANLELTYHFSSVSGERSRIWFGDLGGTPAVLEDDKAYTVLPRTVLWNQNSTIVGSNEVEPAHHGNSGTDYWSRFFGVTGSDIRYEIATNPHIPAGLVTPWSHMSVVHMN